MAFQWQPLCSATSNRLAALLHFVWPQMQVALKRDLHGVFALNTKTVDLLIVMYSSLHAGKERRACSGNREVEETLKVQITVEFIQKPPRTAG